jgi:hypothetical protein
MCRSVKGLCNPEYNALLLRSWTPGNGPNRERVNCGLDYDTVILYTKLYEPGFL